MIDLKELISLGNSVYVESFLLYFNRRKGKIEKSFAEFLFIIKLILVLQNCNNLLIIFILYLFFRYFI